MELGLQGAAITRKKANGFTVTSKKKLRNAGKGQSTTIDPQPAGNQMMELSLIKKFLSFRRPYGT